MPHFFNQYNISIITDDLRIFLNAGKGAIDKLDYFSTILTNIETAGSIELTYCYENIDIVSEVENAVVQQLEFAAKRELNIQLNFSPAALMVYADRLFLQQIFFRLLSDLFEASEKGSVISVYVTDSDGKCIIEVINQNEISGKMEADAYFKKHRITNAFQAPSAQSGDVLTEYKKIIEDMGGELSYPFAKDALNYFRLKFAIV